MYVIVPLAGPDFVSANGKVKSLCEINSEPVLKAALESRPWFGNVFCYIFTLYDCNETRLFYSEYLVKWFPGCKAVFIPSFTLGAAFSVLPALSLISDVNTPIIIDLADILYVSRLDLTAKFLANTSLGAIALSFTSSKPEYSYLQCSSDGFVQRAAEKSVISSNASAGTYIFRDVAVYLDALSHSVINKSSQTYNDLFYVCPLFNGVVSRHRQVVLEPVDSVVDLKFMY